jgi:hypothetical protein
MFPAVPVELGPLWPALQANKPMVLAQSANHDEKESRSACPMTCPSMVQLQCDVPAGKKYPTAMHISFVAAVSPTLTGADPLFSYVQL